MKYLALTAMLAIGATAEPSIPKGSKVYLHPMGGFDSYLAAALLKKEVPVSITKDVQDADFEIEGEAFRQVPNWTMIMQPAVPEQASISITDRKTGQVIFAYSVTKGAMWGRKSTAEACAKHIKKATR